MVKKIICILSVFLVSAMLFSFTGCVGQTEEETTTTIKTKTPLPTELTTSYDENGELITETEYSEEQIAANTKTVFEYFNIHINELKEIKASVSMSRSKSIGKTEITKTEIDENGNEVETTESVPISDNEYVNIAITNLDSLMLDTSGDSLEYGDDIKAFLPVKGESYVSALTLADIESATCVDNETDRTVTITLKSPALPETLKKAYDIGNIDEIMAEFEKANAYLTAEKPTLQYKNCQIIVRADLETDEVTSIEYIRNIDVTTTVTGQGNLASVGTVPVTFRYNESVRYSIDRTDPNAPTVIE